MQLVNDALAHFKTMAAETRAQLRQMQGSPIGTTQRSPQKEAALWRRVSALEEPEFQSAMDHMAEKAGHTNDEKQPCDACTFVYKHAARGTK